MKRLGLYGSLLTLLAGAACSRTTDAPIPPPALPAHTAYLRLAADGTNQALPL